MKKRWVLVLAVALTGALLWLRRPQAAKVEHGDDSAALTDLRDQIRRLQMAVQVSQVVAQAATQAASTRARAAAARAEEEGGRAPAPAEAPPPPTKVSSVAELRQQAERRFRDEAKDSLLERARRAGRAKAPVARVTRGLELRSVECHATQCRGEMSHADRSTYMAYVRQMATSPDREWSDSGVTGYLLGDLPDGRVEVALYLDSRGDGPAA